ncbi:MAG: polyprenyl synthetase family protein [Chrysiogenetes bacterium]|nr:polyprenyl synthetase family protein [Chrysiogenetes bacterium]
MTTKKTAFSFNQYLKSQQKIVERELARRAKFKGYGQLGEAMQYALLGGGKRLRPILVLAACEAVGGKAAAAYPAACAIEMIHTYSLVHDDLPSMDDDDLRRGRPTTHKKYDEATAILVGDALLTQAFTVLTDPRAGLPLADKKRAELVLVLSDAAGWRGMVGGQALDMAAEKKQISLKELRTLHGAKTGALLTASLSMGAIVGGASAKKREALERYGRSIGLAFQVVDDILDVTADTATLGKPAGSDEGHDKSTFPKLMGLDKSRKEAARLIAQAKKELAPFGKKAEPLLALADYIGDRTN